MRARIPSIACIGILAMTAAPTAHADLVIYRCTDASGAVTVQNDQRCPAGSREERPMATDAPDAP